ncbi:MAG: EutN/CcmL family microcompartment protein [Actinomycetota bacterium]|jgi:ethanolamine utilization protein EutN|nr:EutN/CcmL family microcompartment protein [Actinomycetota bacterium]
MRLGKVIGNVISTMKHPKLSGIKLMVVKPVDPEGRKSLKPVILADYLNTAVGNTVFWIEDGTTICKVLGMKSIPLRGSIVGIIDSMDIKKRA